jgi:hypothetical protein
MSNQTRPQDGQEFGKYIDEQVEAGFKVRTLPRSGVKTTVNVGAFYFDIPEEYQDEKAKLDIEAIRACTTKAKFNEKQFFLNVDEDAESDDWTSQ